MAAADDVTLGIVTLLPKDAAPVIFDSSFLKVAEADELLRLDDLVIGVEIDGEARAYDVVFLNSHEMVNDVVVARSRSRGDCFASRASYMPRNLRNGRSP